MAITPFSLAEALRSIGNAEVYIGNPLIADGMDSLGATEGTATFSAPNEMNMLTAPEMTGGTPHSATVTPGAVTIRVPVIMGDPALLAKIAPWGTASAGWSTPQSVTETSALLIPRAEVGGGLAYNAAQTRWERTAGNNVAAANGVDAAPKHAIWLWRAYLSFGDLPFAYANGGKVITEVTITAMFSGSKPEGHKIYTIGDPRAITPTPIPVLL